MEGDAGAPDVKPKATKPRANKTPLQKEVLEASYQLNQHPSVDHRKALGDRIGLTEQEVQAWFTNRRRKDKLAEAKKATGTPGAEGAAGGAAAAPSPGAAVPGAPAGTIPHAAAAGSPAPGAVPAASPKPKAPRAPKAPKLSPTGAAPVVPGQSPPGAAAMGVAGPIPGAPGQLPPGVPAAVPMGGPAGLARHIPAAAAAAPAAASAAAEEEETEDGDEDSGPAAAAWENIRQLCVAARATLPMPFREDGPELGFLFDEPPMPGELAGGGGKRRRMAGPEAEGVGGGGAGGPEGVGSVLLRRPGGNKPIVGQEAGPVGVMTVAELEMRRQQLLMQQQQQQAVLDAARAQAEANGGGAPTGATAKAINAMQKEQERLRKELLKQQERMERERKREADERHRELERHQKEQRKLNDKLEKERAKEEARKLKEMEKMKIAEERELRRLEAAREKERKAEERRKAVEERKKEKDTRRAIIQQERLVLRQRHREGAAGPPDDEELEYRQLLEAAGIDPATIALDPDEDAAQAAAQAAADQALVDAGVPVPAATPPPRKRPRPDLPRPPFPPPSLELHPAWPAPERQPPQAAAAAGTAGNGDAEMTDAEAAPQAPEATPAPEDAQAQPQEQQQQPEVEQEEELSDSLDPDLGTELLVCWSFLQSFADLFGVAVPSLEQLLGALAAGEDSRLLGDVHCALLRLLQADMEDAHDEKERVGRPTANVPHFMDKSVAGSAQRLEEAWAWGFDVDAWRAHLNGRTWPEVLRQVAIVWGRGRARPAVRRPAQDLSKGPRIQGMEGEDVLDDGATGGSLKLRMPQRYTHGTVKAAAWQVLANVGPNGLSVGDLVRRIQKQGLREMRSSKTPEAVVAGSLARDVLFTKVAPATWALTAVVEYHKRKNEARERREAAAAGKKKGGGGGKASDGGAAPGGDGDAEMAEAGAGAEAAGEEAQVKEEAGAKKDGGGAGGRKAKKEPGAAVKEEPKEDATPGAASPAPMDTDAPADGVKQEPKDGGDAGPSSDGADGKADVKQEDAKDGGEAGKDGGAGAEDEEYSGEEEEQQQEEEEQQQEEEAASRGTGDAWVAALLDGGYHSLRLRQRIEALSFLCHAVLDGPTVRAKLELRTEEAMARKKAVFEEAKNDKRKRQEEAALRAAAAAEEARKKAEAAAAAAAAAGSAAPTAPGPDGATPVPGSRGATPAPGAPVDPKAIAAELFGGGAAGAAAGAAAAAAVPADPVKAAEEAKRRAEEEEEDKVKRQQRAEEVRRIDEECAIRAEPLGSDRRHNRYWLFTSGEPNDAGTARLWVELAPEGRWRLLTSPEAFDQLVAALDPRGLREGALAQALARVAETVKAAMPGISPVADPTPYDALPPSTRAALEAGAVARGAVARLAAATVLAADDDDYTEGLEFLEADSGPVSALKRDLLRLEAAVPADAMADSFHSLSWKERVMNAPGLPELRACLGQLEAALLASPDGTTPGLLATVFHRNPPLVRGAWVEVGREVATALPGHASKEILPPVERPDGGPPPEPNDEPLAWLPATLPALALRLLSLDAHVVYREGAPAGRECLAGYRYTIRPAPLDAQPLAGPPGEDGEPVPTASAALPVAVGGGAVVLTNVLADRGRVREANRRVPELPAEVMAMRARDFALPVDEMREQVEEAERDGLFAVVPSVPGTGASGSAAAVAALAASVGGSKKKGRPLPVALPPGATTKRSSGSKSVVIVRQPTPGLGAPPAGGRGKRGGAAGGGGGGRGRGAAKADKADKKGGAKSKKAAVAATPPPAAEEEGDEDGGAPAGVEDLEEPAYLEDDWEDEGNEEGMDDPDDSDYGF